MRRLLQRWLQACSLAVLSASGLASASERIVVARDAREARAPDLVDAVRIQTVGMGVVLEEPSIQGPTPQALQRMAAILRLRQAQFGLWVEDNPQEKGAGEVVAHLVDSRAGPIAKVTVPRGPGMERTLALKVREAIDAAIQSRQHADAPGSPSKPPPPRTAAAAPTTPVSLIVETSAAGRVPVDGNAGVQFGADLAGGLRWPAYGWAWEPAVAFSLLTPMHRSEDGRELQVHTPQARLELRAVKTWGGVGLGATAWTGAELLSAHGSAPDKTQGSESRLLFRWGVGPVVRLRLHPQLEMSTSITSDAAFHHQHYTVRGEPILDVGMLQLRAHIGLIATTL